VNPLAPARLSSRAREIDDRIRSRAARGWTSPSRGKRSSGHGSARNFLAADSIARLEGADDLIVALRSAAFPLRPSAPTSLERLFVRVSVR
jgi:hypothetical protein